MSKPVFAKFTNANGNEVWIEPDKIVAFGIDPMAIKSRRGIDLRDGLWVRCMDYSADPENDYYLLDETPQSFLEKIDKAYPLNPNSLVIADKLEKYNAWRRGHPPYDAPGTEPITPKDLGETIDEAVKILRSSC